MLCSQGVSDYEPLRRNRRQRLDELKTGDGRPLPPHLKAQISRELDRLELLIEQVPYLLVKRDCKVNIQPKAAALSLAIRVARIDGNRLAGELNEQGFAVLEKLLSHEECRAIASLYPNDSHFRSRVVMDRHGFGKGEYKYFIYPLPGLIGDLRTALYSRLAAIANEWNERMGLDLRYPAEHTEFLQLCHEAGQFRPTPLLLQYEPGDYNCLHQDLYGELAFPLQVAILLSKPGDDFTGGEFVLSEQRPRMQSRVEVVPLRQGDAVVFAVHHRPVNGTRGAYRVNLRHGVSRLRFGRRYTAGVIFHDAK